MSKTLVEQLAEFTSDVDTSQLPDQVVEESKRILLDSLGCALGGLDFPKGRIGVDYGRIIGGTGAEATIIGTGQRASVLGAAFANGELINALDFDAVLPPGHVTPYVLPGALAVGEQLHCSGEDLIAVIALSHEMTHRFGKAMDYLREVKDGEMVLPQVLGYSSSMFGATAAVGRLRGASTEVLANALGIAASISPVNSQRPWLAHAPSSTIKYTLAGTVAQSALTAASMAELGHRGDLRILDDGEFGYRRFIGTSRWVPEPLVSGLGSEWLFPAQQSYKPYPHCRILHGLLDLLTELVERHDLKPAEIEGIRAWGEASVLHPVWLSRDIEHVHDAQFSIAHGLAVGAHGVTPGPAWNQPELVFSRSVLDLMDKVEFAPHPDYVREFSAHPAARPSRIEVSARGTTFTAERAYPKGSPSPDPATTMTTGELIAKFRVNAAGVLSEERMDEVVASVLALEAVEDIATVLRQVAE